MQVSYQKDFNYNYLVLRSEQEVQMESYQMRILLGNEAKMLLPCRIQTLDGRRAFCYDITSKQLLADRLRKRRLRGEDLRKLLLGLVEALEHVQAYLMDVNCLILDPDYMYYDEETEEWYLCYFPEYEKNIRDQFRSFVEYLLPLADHQDPAGVAMIYGIYRQAVEDRFHMDQIREFVCRSFEEEKPPQRPGEEAEAQAAEENAPETEEERQRQEVLREFFEEEMEEEAEGHGALGLFFASFAWSAAFLGTCVLRSMGYLPFLTFPMIFGIFMAVLVILGINLYLCRRRKPEREEKEEEQRPVRWSEGSMAQASIQWPGKQVADPQEIRQICRQAEEEEDPVPEPGKKDPGDTQPLPKLFFPEGGKLVSKEPGLLPDIVIRGDLTIIGKLEGTADALLALPTVSRIHAKIRKVGEEYYVTDLGSSNGTYLNGYRLAVQENWRIAPGDELRFADAAYIFAP